MTAAAAYQTEASPSPTWSSPYPFRTLRASTRTDSSTGRSSSAQPSRKYECRRSSRSSGSRRAYAPSPRASGEAGAASPIRCACLPRTSSAPLPGLRLVHARSVHLLPRASYDLLRPSPADDRRRRWRLARTAVARRRGGALRSRSSDRTHGRRGSSAVPPRSRWAHPAVALAQRWPCARPPQRPRRRRGRRDRARARESRRAAVRAW